MNSNRNQYTSVVDVCSGNAPDELFLACNNHDEGDYLDSVVATLVLAKITDNGLKCSILLNALDHVPDYVPIAHCIARSGAGDVYVGETSGLIRYATGKIEAIELGGTVLPGSLMLCAYTGSNNDIIFGTSNWGIVNLNLNDSTFTSQSIAPISPDKGQFINRIHGIGSAFMVAVGDAGMVAVCRDGQWAKVACPSNTDLRGAWCRSDREIYICGHPNFVWRWDGDGRWQKLSIEFAGDENSLYFFDLAEYQGDIYAACGRNGVFKLVGDKFVAMPNVGAKCIERLQVTTSGLIGVSAIWGNDGNWFTRFDGKTWTAEQINIKL